jgi:tetratricopeptide (TPR) repeat protein
MRTTTPAGADRSGVPLNSRLVITLIAGSCSAALLFNPARAQEARIPASQADAAALEPDVTGQEPVTSGPLPDATGGEGAPGAPATRTLPQEVLAVPGVRQGMDDKQLVEVVESALKTRQLDDAERILRYLVIQSPRLLPAQSLLAYTCELQMEAFSNPRTPSPQKAEFYKKEAVRYYLAAGKLALEQELYPATNTLFVRVAKYEPANPEMKLGLARFHAATERNMLAIEHYNEYIKSAQGQLDSQAWLELGQVFHRSGFIGQAVTTLQKAVNMNPDNPEIHYELALTYLDDQRIDQARGVAQTAMQKGATKPNYHKFVNLYARILFSGNQFDEAEVQAIKALRLAREALVKEPESVMLLQASVGYHETLERILKAKIDAMPEEVRLRLTLARSMADKTATARLLNLHAALRVLPPLEGENRSNIELLELAAELQLNVHKLEDCSATCKRLLELDADNARAREILQRLPAELQPTAGSDAGTGNPAVAATP